MTGVVAVSHFAKLPSWSVPVSCQQNDIYQIFHCLVVLLQVGRVLLELELVGLEVALGEGPLLAHVFPWHKHLYHHAICKCIQYTVLTAKHSGGVCTLQKIINIITPHVNIPNTHRTHTSTCPYYTPLCVVGVNIHETENEKH